MYYNYKCKMFMMLKTNIMVPNHKIPISGVVKGKDSSTNS